MSETSLHKPSCHLSSESHERNKGFGYCPGCDCGLHDAMDPSTEGPTTEFWAEWIAEGVYDVPAIENREEFKAAIKTALDHICAAMLARAGEDK